MPYDNGHGFRINFTKSYIRVEIYSNGELYLPFINLRNLGASTDDIETRKSTDEVSDGKTYFYIPNSRFTAVMAIAHNVPRIKIPEDESASLHVISPSELLLLAYTLPAFIVKEIIDYTHLLSYKMATEGSPIFNSKEPGSLFGSVVAEYISLRDNLNPRDYVIVEGTNDPIQWTGSHFYVTQQN